MCVCRLFSPALISHVNARIKRIDHWIKRLILPCQEGNKKRQRIFQTNIKLDSQAVAGLNINLFAMSIKCTIQFTSKLATSYFLESTLRIKYGTRLKRTMSQGAD